MIDELKEQLGGVTPDAIICSVGGGGLMNGVILGCQKAGWDKGNTSWLNAQSKFVENDAKSGLTWQSCLYPPNVFYFTFVFLAT